MEQEFTVEHHAVYYALLVKQALSYDEEQGKDRVLQATRRYGEDRGRRMAGEAQKNGDPLIPATYFVYGELPAVTGESESALSFENGHIHSTVTKCGWIEAWKRHGLLEYGRCYCEVIDEGVYAGFSPSLKLKIASRLSCGEDACRFDFGQWKDTDGELVQEAAGRLGDRFRKDFLFHTRKLKEVMGGYLEEVYGEKGFEMTKKADEEFGLIFGEKFSEALTKEADCRGQGYGR